jgi:acetylornithine aminotransferase
MRAGVETVRIMEAEGLLDNAIRVGTHLKAALERGLAAELASGSVREIRGMGLMLGIDLRQPCGALVQRALDKGLLISVTADSVVRLVPPLILSVAEAEEIAAILCPLISALLKEAP